MDPQQSQAAPIPNQPVAPPPNPPLPPPTRPKWPWILLGVVLLLALGTSGVFWKKQIASHVAPSGLAPPLPSPTPDPTAGWKTYINEQHGISFKYPPTFREHNLTKQDSALLVQYYLASENLEMGTGVLSGVTKGALIGFSVQPLAPPDFITNRCKTLKMGSPNLTCKQEIILGYRAARVDSETYSALFLEKDNQVLSLELDSPQEKEMYIKSFDQILSTFRFLLNEHDAKQTSDINGVLIGALEMYRADNQTYPEKLELLVPNYLPLMPLDPATQTMYKYQLAPNKLDYSITAIRENGSIYIVNSPTN